VLCGAQATKDVLALASVEIDLSNIAMGSTVTIKWRGKPVFIRRRTAVRVPPPPPSALAPRLPWSPLRFGTTTTPQQPEGYCRHTIHCQPH
jgi:hypothetical protein